MENSDSGKNILSKGLSGKEIVAIIRACASCGVAELSLGELHIAFTHAEDATQLPDYHLNELDSSAQSNEHPDQPSPATVSRQHQLETLMVTDPAAFEAALMQSEI